MQPAKTVNARGLFPARRGGVAGTTPRDAGMLRRSLAGTESPKPSKATGEQVVLLSNRRIDRRATPTS